MMNIDLDIQDIDKSLELKCFPYICMIDTWASTWGVDFNPSKTCNIIFSRSSFKHQSVHFGYNGNVIN